LLQRLGIEIDFATRQCRIPTLPEFIAAYERIIAEHVAAGISPDDVIRPGRAFSDESGQLHFISYLVKPSAGWAEIDTSELGPDAIGRMLASGLFPLSQRRMGHDLAHLTGFLSHPEYMTGIRRLVSQFRSTGPGPSGPSRYWRAIHALEGLALV